MKRVFNFSAGPAVLPEPVLRQAAAEMLDYNDTGMSVTEMSHRSKAFEQIIQDAEKVEASAPDSTGIGRMRWPVRGRVITAYGGKNAGYQ